MSSTAIGVKPRASHIFPRQKESHYAEPAWCSQRLFDVEKFSGNIYDPACGFGTIVISALAHGHLAAGSDIVNRGWDSTLTPCDFLKESRRYDNIVSNPPYDNLQAFVTHMVRCAKEKAAALVPLARLPAAHWLEDLPLARIYLLTPRPSIPPGDYIRAGGKVGGGRVDFCWLVFEVADHYGLPEMLWLHRDPVAP